VDDDTVVLWFEKQHTQCIITHAHTHTHTHTHTRPTVPDAKPLFIELGFKAFDHQLDDECVAVFDPYDIKASEDEIFEANKVSNWCSPELLEG
jgi:hypothetical protein